MAVKELDRQFVITENRLAEIKEELRQAEQNLESIKEQIVRKTNDYSTFMALRDAESKKLAQNVHLDSEQLATDKSEFQAILKQFQADKVAVDRDKNANGAERAQLKAQKDSIQGFITSVQRALSLLGL